MSAQQIAEGQFKVQMNPLREPDVADEISLGQMSLSKQFEGDLVGESLGSMLTTHTTQPDSAVYVAIERVSGNLQGRAGSFVLYHQGVMEHGARQLSIRIAPDSGTGELAGIAGELKIRIDAGQHFFSLHYSLPDS